MKIILFILFSITCFSQLFGQNNFAKINHDIIIEIDSIDYKIYKNEIFSIVGDTNLGIYIDFGEDSVFIKVEKIKGLPKYYKSSNKQFEPHLDLEKLTNVITKIKIDGGHYYKFDFSEFKKDNNIDTVYVVTNDNKIPLINKNELTKELTQFGDFIRIIVAGAPTFFYDTSAIKYLLPDFDKDKYDIYKTKDGRNVAIKKDKTKAFWKTNKQNPPTVAPPNDLIFKNVTLKKIPTSEEVSLKDGKVLKFKNRWIIKTKFPPWYIYIAAALFIFIIIILLRFFYGKRIKLVFWECEKNTETVTLEYKYKNKINNFIKDKGISSKKLKKLNKSLIEDKNREGKKGKISLNKWNKSINKEIIIGKKWKLINKYKNSNEFSFLLFKRIKEEDKRQFNHSSLTDFAKKYHIALSELIKLNPVKLHPDYKTLPTESKDEIKNNLQQEKLIVGYKNEIVWKYKKHIDKTKSPETLELKKSSEQHPIPIDSINTGQIFTQLKSMIQTLHNNNQRSFNSVNNELSELKKYNKQLLELNNANTIRLSEKIETIEKTNINLNKNLNEEKKEKENYRDQFKEFQIKYNDLIKSAKPCPDELVNYSKKIVNFSEFIQKIEDDVYNIIIKTNKYKVSDTEYLIVSEIINSFISSIDKKSNNKWFQVFKDINQLGITTDKEIINRIEDFKNTPEELIYSLKKFLYNRIWNGYLSNLVIVCEELRNLDRYINNDSEFTHNLIPLVTDSIKNIRFKTKDILNLEINYVPLFEDYEKYNFTKCSTENTKDYTSQLNLKNFEKHDIIEIINYGFKNKNDFEKEDSNVVIIN